MNIGRLAGSIAESPTLKLNSQAAALKAAGEPVIHLGGGEPKNKTPEAAVLAAKAKLDSGEVKYTPSEGVPSLKKAIVRYTEENYGRSASPGNVIVSAGAKPALFSLLYAILDPGDEVLILAPYWVSYPEMVRMVGGVPVVLKPGEGRFVPTLREIERTLTPKTKAVIVNSPNNPSGAVYPEELVADLVRLCESRGVVYISDDIYHKLVFGGKKAASPYACTDKDIESTQVVSVNGISKVYGMTGFRIGWVVAPRKLVEVMGNVQGQILSCASALAQAAAEGALTGPQTPVVSLCEALQRNRDVMMRELSAMKKLKVREPEGTFYCLPDFSAYKADSMELCRFLLEKALVVTVPGREFGMEGHLRLSYCTSAEDVIEGVSRIRWALDPESPEEIEIGGKRRVRDWA
ncbi:MAG: pyridoxal phosphate-dependent aminotransferase [Elusimicrobiota bacterium]